jgi:hypothetical protein
MRERTAMNPIFTLASGRSLIGYVADLLGVDASSIVGQELSLVDSRRCTIFGDVVLSPRLDDLASAYCVLRGFLDGRARGCANVRRIATAEAHNYLDHLLNVRRIATAEAHNYLHYPRLTDQCRSKSHATHFLSVASLFGQFSSD